MTVYSEGNFEWSGNLSHLRYEWHSKGLHLESVLGTPNIGYVTVL